MPGLILAVAGVLVALAGGPGGMARWAQAEALPADGVVATGQVALTGDGVPTFSVGGVVLNPATESVCVGEVVRVGLPVRVLATGTTMAPVLTRTTIGTVPGHVSVRDVNLASINAALRSSAFAQVLTVQVGVASTQPGRVTLGHELVLAARAGSSWTSEYTVTSAVVGNLDFMECGTLVTTWDTTLASPGQPHASLFFGVGTDVRPWGRVDWGDGTPPGVVGHGRSTHDYATPGVYTVTVTGRFGSITFDGSDALVSVDQWDQDTGTQSIQGTFAGADNLRSAVSPPSTVTDMTSAFQDSQANPDLIDWDTSNVTDLSMMFYYAPVFNGDVSAWDTSKATTMYSMFAGASAFNGDVSRWDTRNVTNMATTFYQARVFNGDVSGWDTSKATDMSSVFNGASSFNGDLSGWDTGKVTRMFRMFWGASAFNGDVSGWDTGNVTTMDAMFANAAAFTGDLRGWNVVKIPSEPTGFRSSANALMQSPIWGTAGGVAPAGDGIERSTPEEVGDPASPAAVEGGAGVDPGPGPQVPGPGVPGSEVPVPEPSASAGGIGAQGCVVGLLRGIGSGCADVA